MLFSLHERYKGKLDFSPDLPFCSVVWLLCLSLVTIMYINLNPDITGKLLFGVKQMKLN